MMPLFRFGMMPSRRYGLPKQTHDLRRTHQPRLSKERARFMGELQELQKAFRKDLAQMSFEVERCACARQLRQSCRRGHCGAMGHVSRRVFIRFGDVRADRTHGNPAGPIAVAMVRAVPSAASV